MIGKLYIANKKSAKEHLVFFVVILP